MSVYVCKILEQKAKGSQLGILFPDPNPGFASYGRILPTPCFENKVSLRLSSTYLLYTVYGYVMLQ